MALTEQEKYERKSALLKKALEQADKMDAKDKEKKTADRDKKKQEQTEKAKGDATPVITMEPTIKIYVDTDIGPAIITSTQEFNTLGPYTIVGPGKEIAREWIEDAYGAFGHTVGTNAAPCDLHCAAMDLQRHPEEGIRFIKVEGEIKTYSDGLAEGEIP